jgi:predicted phosphodiesterase
MIKKLQLLSDLHLEFFGDLWPEFVKSVPVIADVLVLAGDIHVGDAIVEVLAAFAKRFKHVVYVAGNHELYGSSTGVFTPRRARAHAISNLYWLENDVVVLDGRRFVGCTLWFDQPADARIKRGMADFFAIQDFEPWVYACNRTSRRFLMEAINEGDIVVTHHLPHPASIAPEFRGSPMNAFFLSDMSRAIAENKPSLWLHGHTHTSVDARVDSTRIACNPFGYAGREENAGFKLDLTLDLD